MKDASITTSKIEDGAITEPKLDTALTAKVHNNVKTVAQTLTGSEVDIASKNLKFKDNYQNFFANRYSYESVTKLSVKPNYHIFGNSCTDNTFGTNCYYTTLGNNCRSNTFGNDCVHNILGDGCSYNIFGKSLECSKIDSGVTYIELRSNASTGRSLKNIHILSGVRGKSSTERLVINIPDEYLVSSRELIITTKRTDGGPSTPDDIVMYYADEVVDKQNKQDNTLATTSKEIVGAINELFNGGVKDKSIGVGKLAQAVQDTLGKVGTNVKVLSSGTDLKTVEEAGVYILSGTKDYLNFPNKWEHYNTSIFIVSGDGNNYNKGKTIIGFQSGSQYPFAATLRNNEWIETDLYTVLTNIKKDVTTLQGLINTKVKIINEDTDLNTITEDGLYLLSAGYKYTNYPHSDGETTPGNFVYPRIPAILIVSQKAGAYVEQVVFSVSEINLLPLIRNREYFKSIAAWGDWNNDVMYDMWKNVNDSVKKQDLLSLTDTEVNNIWDNN